MSRGLAENAIKPYIPRLWRDFLDFLALERKADKLWSQPTLSPLKERKRPIEVTAAHADSIALFIECNDRCHDDINVCGTDNFC